MHKHRSKRSKGARRRQNANFRIPESVAQRVSSVVSDLGPSEEFAVQYLREEFLSKYLDPALATPESRSNAAIDKWLLVEAKNSVTNATLRDRDPGYNILPRVSWSSFLGFARGLISKILGPLPTDVVVGSFSGGASTSRRRTESSPAHKFAGKADMTADVEYLVGVCHREMPLLEQFGVWNEYNVVPGAKLFTVPKKTDIDRCACKEPDFNMFLQKGVGAFIRKRLRRFGINLNDQAVNRSLAADGAQHGHLATLDLSSASDTITIECVRTLLPSDWFLYLNDIRSHLVEVRGNYHRTEMFSSMGNGFTFELESLIFLALARTTLYFEGIPGRVSVYGDDIICPSDGADMVAWVLESFGFSINPDKSFSSGPFRESCGGHYYGQEDVTPFYLKREATHLTDVIRVANQLRRWAMADPFRQYLVPTTYKVWSLLVEAVPKVLWGGSDYASDTILVSPGLPNKQLIRLSEKRKLPQSGAYLHWHCSTWRRTSDPDDVAADPVDTNNRCRLRAVRFGIPFHQPLFREELG